jgi:hypothetical protein
VNSTETWLEDHSYSAGDHCEQFERGFGINITLDSKEFDLVLERDKRALAGKWIVIILSIFHILKEFFQIANVSKMKMVIVFFLP